MTRKKERLVNALMAVFFVVLAIALVVGVIVLVLLIAAGHIHPQ